MKKFKLMVVAACFVFALAVPAGATIFSLDFSGLQNQEEILNFSNGGLGGNGSGPGPNYGVVFGSGALALIDADAGGSGNFANEPSADTVAFWLTGGGLVMDVAAGFDTGFSFYYTSSTAASVTVYDGLGATGNLLATINLGVNWQNNNCTGDPSGAFCNWDPIGVSFSGIAKSVDFSGTANQTGYDNVTFGTETPTGVPEPATLLLLGLGLIGLAAKKAKI